MFYFHDQSKTLRQNYKRVYLGSGYWKYIKTIIKINVVNK